LYYLPFFPYQVVHAARIARSVTILILLPSPCISAALGVGTRKFLLQRCGPASGILSHGKAVFAATFPVGALLANTAGTTELANFSFVFVGAFSARTGAGYRKYSA
jgi:hypothetical protein